VNRSPQNENACCDGSHKSAVMRDAQKASFDPIQAVLVISVKMPSAMLIATTSDEFRPLALSADAAPVVASILRSGLHIFLACVRDDVIDLRAHLRFRSLTSTTCMLSMTVLD